MTVTEAYSLVSAAIDAGRAANGYVIAGPVRGEGGRLAAKILARIFCESPLPGGEPCRECGSCRRLADGVHPDVHVLRPEKKSRVISVDSMRERMLEPMSKTAFAGGWKAGVIESADRMNESSMNAFLKLLEEPPARTIFLLVSDSPEGLLPTILSRCQIIDVSGGARRELAEPWRGRVKSVLAGDSLCGLVEKSIAAQQLAGLLGEMKDAAEREATADAERDGKEHSSAGAASRDAVDALVSSRYREYRAEFVQTLLGWFRDLMAIVAAGPDAPIGDPAYRALLAERAANLDLARAFANLDAVSDMALSFERNLSEEPVLALFCDRVSFGAGGAG